MLVNGEPEKVDEDRAKEILGLEDFEVSVDLGMGGNGEAKYWTCDFSYVGLLPPSSRCLSADYLRFLRRNMLESMEIIGAKKERVENKYC